MKDLHQILQNQIGADHTFFPKGVAHADLRLDLLVVGKENCQQGNDGLWQSRSYRREDTADGALCHIELATQPLYAVGKKFRRQQNQSKRKKQ
jgi:hypothetical protein